MIYTIYYHSSSLGQENKKLLDLIKTFPGWAILSPSFFLVRSGNNAINTDRDQYLFEVKHKLTSISSPNDEFFISQLGNESTWQGYGGKLRDWIIRNSRANDSSEAEKESVSQTECNQAANTIQKQNDSPIGPNGEAE